MNETTDLACWPKLGSSKDFGRSDPFEGAQFYWNAVPSS